MHFFVVYFLFYFVRVHDLFLKFLHLRLILIMPSFFRMFACTMQRYVLFAFQKVLVSSPSLVDVFRAEGVWDFIFSESFFYFDPTPAELSGNDFAESGVPLVDTDEASFGSNDYDGRESSSEVGSFQVAVISFVEFAATLSGSSHNLVCSVRSLIISSVTLVFVAAFSHA